MHHRPRRLRRTAGIRRLTAEIRLHSADLVLPMFYREGAAQPLPISSMPGVVQHSLDSLRREATEAASAGVGGVMLFAVPEERDEVGSRALDPAGPLAVAVAAVKQEIGDAVPVMADVCLDEFTNHGQCGVLDSAGQVANDETVARYADMSVVLAQAGADVLGLSGMMDGQVGAARAALEQSGHPDTVLLAYAAKYASAFYGPFREAVDSQLDGDRRSYQQDPANRKEALREAELDREEGADIIMVKPAMSYLDVLADIADSMTVPVAAYQVSGEYAMIEAAAASGWIDRDAAVLESLVAIKRAGADIILSYYATPAMLPAFAR